MMYDSIEAYSDIADNDFGSFADDYFDAMADMYEEEGYAQMKEDPYFAEYRPEQCLLRTENTGIRCQNTV